MKKIAFVFIAAMAVLSFTGCKKKGGAGEAMAKMEGFKNDMCKCADKACAEKVSKAMEEWTKSMGEKGEKMMKEMSDEDKKKATAIGEELGKCLMKHMAAAMPDPAAGGDKAATPPAGGEGEKKMDDKAAAPAGDEKAAAPAGDEKKPEEKK
jgi:hypothetical protein